MLREEDKDALSQRVSFLRTKAALVSEAASVFLEFAKALERVDNPEDRLIIK